MGRRTKEKITAETYETKVKQLIMICEDIPDNVKVRLLQLSKQIQTEEQCREFQLKVLSLSAAWHNENFIHYDGWSMKSNEHDICVNFGCEQGSCFSCTNPCENGVTDQSWLEQDYEECLENFEYGNFYEGITDD